MSNLVLLFIKSVQKKSTEGQAGVKPFGFNMAAVHLNGEARCNDTELVAVVSLPITPE